LAISATGSWAYNVALIVYVYQDTHSAAWVGASTMARFIPALLFSSYAGVIAERFERHRVLITSDLLCCVYSIGMASVAAAHGPATGVIISASLTSITGSVYIPATTALIPQIVTEDDLAAANGINGAIDNLAILVGPAVGGLMLAAVEPATVMWI